MSRSLPVLIASLSLIMSCSFASSRAFSPIQPQKAIVPGVLGRRGGKDGPRGSSWSVDEARQLQGKCGEVWGCCGSAEDVGTQTAAPSAPPSRSRPGQEGGQTCAAFLGCSPVCAICLSALGTAQNKQTNKQRQQVKTSRKRHCFKMTSWPNALRRS